MVVSHSVFTHVSITLPCPSRHTFHCPSQPQCTLLCWRVLLVDHGWCITQCSPYMGFLTSDAKIHSHKPWRPTALREPLSAASFGTSVQGQVQGLFSKHRRWLVSDPCWEGKVFSNKVFLSCLLAYILLRCYRQLVSKRVLWRHEERFSRRRYSTLWEKNTSCFYPQFFPGNGRHGSRLAKGWSVQNGDIVIRCKCRQLAHTGSRYTAS